MAREPFVSGAFRSTSEFKEAPKTIDQIVDTAIQKKRLRRSLHQRYDSKQTPQTRKNTLRMLGERDE